MKEVRNLKLMKCANEIWAAQGRQSRGITTQLVNQDGCETLKEEGRHRERKIEGC